jgi:hypothetical protein
LSHARSQRSQQSASAAKTNDAIIDRAHLRENLFRRIKLAIAATNCLGLVNGDPVAHVAVSPRFEIGDAIRSCWLVILPEWQGAGIGVPFLNGVCAAQTTSKNCYGRKCVIYFHTSDPQLAAALRRQDCWASRSAVLNGGDKVRSARSINASRSSYKGHRPRSGFGDHFRDIQRFNMREEKP